MKSWGMIFLFFFLSWFQFSIFAQKSNHTGFIYGQVVSTHQVQLGFQTAGTISSLPVSVGEIVKKGQTLGALVNDSQKVQILLEQEKLKQAEAQLEEQTRIFKKEEELFSQNVTSKDAFTRIKLAFDLATITLNQAKLLLRNAEQNFSHTILKAPFAGEIIQRYFDEGSYVTPGMNIFRLVDSINLRVEFNVPEHLHQKFQKNQKLKASIDALDNQLMTLTITQIPSLIQEDRTFKILAEFEKKGKNVLAGMHVKAKLESL
jgi:RND family efflux transporter MFP subunit